MVLPPFPRLLTGIEYLAHLLYPDTFLPARPGRSPRTRLGMRDALRKGENKGTAQNMRYPFARNILIVQPLNSAPIMPAERMIQSTGFKPPLSMNM